MSERPLAYHITFGTYGTRMHGDPRGTVDRLHNRYGDRIIGGNKDWLAIEKANLVGEPVVFDLATRVYVEQMISLVCKRGGWECHSAACQTNHVHVFLTSSDESKLTRRLLKRWLSERLNSECKALPTSGRWWAKGGSIKWVWDERYFENVKRYIERQRASES